MKNLLILSYYYPPLGLSGVQRTVKFVKYLPQFGWNPIVIAPRPRGSYVYDPALCAEVAQAPVFRTFSLDPLFLSPRKHTGASLEKNAFASRVNRWLVPDNKTGWIPFALQAGLKAARQFPIDAIYSTAPPYSSHLAGVLLKKLLGRPLAADFRDAWTSYTWTKYPAGALKKLDHRLEELVLKNADLVTAVNSRIIEDLAGLHPEVDSDKFCLVSHGYDPEDFAGASKPDPNYFTIAYTGTFINNRSPRTLFEAVKLMRKQNVSGLDKLRIVFAGSHRESDLALVNEFELNSTVRFTGYLTHQQSIKILTEADLLWLAMGPEETANVTPGKLFEYLGARKPILASVPLDGQAASIITAAKVGVCIPPGDSETTAGFLKKAVRAWREHDQICRGDENQLSQYNRRQISGILARHLDRLDRNA
ncbi:MAG: glycosyltransferase family 4 protein [bacterium]|nr:glycosyltransferase family 4 protein [bacterium]